MSARRLIPVVLVVGAVAVLALVGASLGSDQRTLRAAFDGATNMIAGNDVRVAGRKVGVVRSVDLVDGHAMLDLEISDERAWPLNRGTTARLRYGSPAAYASRYVELEPAPDSHPAIPAGGLLTRADTQTPVEFDDVYRILNREGRAQLRGLIDNSAAALEGTADDLGPGLASAGDGFEALSDFMAELNHDRAALQTLVQAGSRTAAAIASRDQELGELISGLAATYDELAARTQPTIAALERFPDTLVATRATLARTDQSVSILQELTDDLAPGARELRGFAPTAARTVSTLREVAPLATSTLERATAATPPIRDLLDEGTPFLSRLGDVARRASPMVGCLRPYGPEIAAFPATWAGLGKNYDHIDHHSRTHFQSPPYPNGSQMTSEQLVRSTPGVEYAFPRPPGLNAGRPWFQPQCGAGPGALDPSNDPEAVGGP